MGFHLEATSARFVGVGTHKLFSRHNPFFQLRQLRYNTQLKRADRGVKQQVTVSNLSPKLQWPGRSSACLPACLPFTHPARVKWLDLELSSACSVPDCVK